MKILETWSVKRNDRGTRTMCMAKCDCGDISQYDKSNITRGNTTRCKSCAAKSRAEKRKTHGCSVVGKSGENERGTYSVWLAMKSRCNNPKNKRYHDYGGRGIKVCSQWESFESFISCMGFRPTNHHQIDRIDNNGDYTPENCRWVTRKENSRNKRNNKILTVNGESKCLSEWAEQVGISQDTIGMRISRGWSDERAIFGTRHKKEYNTPDGKFKTLREVQDFYGMSSSGVHTRFKSKNFPDWTIKE